MNIRIKRYLIGVFVCIKFISCKCNDTYDCPAISNNTNNYFNFTTADTIKFVNDFGQQLTFGFKEKSQTSPYTAKACKGGPVFCSCGYDCSANGFSKFLSDSFRNYKNYIRYYIDETSQSLKQNSGLSTGLLYEIFDFSRSISLTDSVQFFSGDSLISSVTLGAHTYSNVFAQVIDTLQSANINIKIWKTYLTKENGIIGFYDRQTRSLFYRQ